MVVKTWDEDHNLTIKRSLLYAGFSVAHCIEDRKEKIEEEFARNVQRFVVDCNFEKYVLKPVGQGKHFGWRLFTEDEEEKLVHCRNLQFCLEKIARHSGAVPVGYTFDEVQATEAGNLEPKDEVVTSD